MAGTAMGKLAMAEQQGYETSVAAKMDYREHQKTYDGFLMFTKYGIVAVVVILILMAIFLV